MPPPPTEAGLLRIAADELGRRLPSGWRIDLLTEPVASRFDARLRLSGPDASEAIFLIAAETSFNTRDVPILLGDVHVLRERTFRSAAPDANVLVAARYLTQRTRELLGEAGVSYVDATGNIRVVSSRPALYVEATGASGDPWRGPERRTNTLMGRPAARVVRALLDVRPPHGVRALSKLSGASLGSTYRTVDFLDREALIQRDPRGTIVTVDWERLLMRWSQDYDFQRSNRVTAGFEPRGIRAVVASLARASGRHAITGSLAAVRAAPVAEPRLAMIFAERPEELVEQLALRPTGPANVLVAKPFDEVVFERTVDEDGLTYVAWSQVAADLLTSPGRGPAEAEALIQWMRENESAWRR